MHKTAEKQFTVRIPGDLYEQARKLARKRGTSLNQLTASGLSELTRKDSEEALRQAYEQLGGDEAQMDVEAYLPAQAEVVDDGRD